MIGQSQHGAGRGFELIRIPYELLSQKAIQSRMPIAG